MRTKQVKRNTQEWRKKRQEVFNELSEAQTMFCCCGKLATGLHELRCGKFNKMVDKQTDKFFY